jgi:hypothetical protein
MSVRSSLTQLAREISHPFANSRPTNGNCRYEADELCHATLFAARSHPPTVLPPSPPEIFC